MGQCRRSGRIQWRWTSRRSVRCDCKVGAGKAAFIGDSSPVEDATPKYLREENGATKKTYDGFKEVDDATFLVNTVKWLAVKESYTSLAQVPGLTFDTATSLLAYRDASALYRAKR